MTREEAIKILKAIRVYECYPKSASEETKEAIDMAIEALQAEYEDYEHATLVDIKEPLVKHDREWIIGCIKHDGFIKTDRFDKANQIILEALSADAVQGEWVCKEREYNDCDGYYAHYWYECSVCGARPPKNQWKNEWHSDYCPSCGARMTPYKGGDTE